MIHASTFLNFQKYLFFLGKLKTSFTSFSSLLVFSKTRSSVLACRENYLTLQS